MNKKITITWRNDEQRKGTAILSGQFDDELEIRRHLAQRLNVDASDIRFTLCEDMTILFSWRG